MGVNYVTDFSISKQAIELDTLPTSSINLEDNSLLSDKEDTTKEDYIEEDKDSEEESIIRNKSISRVLTPPMNQPYL
jgi:hypothetical protein